MEELCSRYQNGSEKRQPAVATHSWCILHPVFSIPQLRSYYELINIRIEIEEAPNRCR